MTVPRLLVIFGSLLVAAGVAMLANAGKQGQAALGEVEAKYAMLVNSGAIDQARVDPRLPGEFRAKSNRAADVADWLTSQSHAGYQRRELSQAVGAVSLGLLVVLAGYFVSRSAPRGGGAGTGAGAASRRT